MHKNILILDYLETSAQRYPHKAAVIDEKEGCTFLELMEQSQSAGSALLGTVKSREPVGVFMEKGKNALAAFLGIVYAGGFYGMLNPRLTDARLAQILSVFDASVMITDREHFFRAKAIFKGKTVVQIEDLIQIPKNRAGLKARRCAMIDTDPLYANFTSGSTGVPKGVVVSHRSVIDFIDCFTPKFGIEAKDVIGNQAPFDFDVSVKDIYSALKTGAQLVVIPTALFSSPARLMDFICEHKVTTMIWAVSALCLLSTFHGLDYKTPEHVRRVLFSGEVMPQKHLNIWMEHLPEAVFVNLYGPTEITCNCTYHVIDRTQSYDGPIPIGRPFVNERVFLLDEHDREILKPGQTGEICVAGTALALGYYNAPDETSRRFTQNPLNPHYPELIYRTGDLGYMDAGGELYFCGRKDFQIKYQGHRIELEEIERAACRIDGIWSCVCVFDAKKSRLWGFYTGTLSQSELAGALREVLPDFMLPSVLRRLEQMPLTANGKTDRRALEALLNESRHS